MTNNNTTVKGYKIDFTNNTIVMNYKFSKQAMIYGMSIASLLTSQCEPVFVVNGRNE